MYIYITLCGNVVNTKHIHTCRGLDLHRTVTGTPLLPQVTVAVPQHKCKNASLTLGDNSTHNIKGQNSSLALSFYERGPRKPSSIAAAGGGDGTAWAGEARTSRSLRAGAWIGPGPGVVTSRRGRRPRARGCQRRQVRCDQVRMPSSFILLRPQAGTASGLLWPPASRTCPVAGRRS